MVEIHFSWDRMYTYLRIRKFQLSRLNGVKISQFPWRVSILESSTIFSDESVSFVRGSASFHSFPTFEIRMGGRGGREFGRSKSPSNFYKFVHSAILIILTKRANLVVTARRVFRARRKKKGKRKEMENENETTTRSNERESKRTNERTDACSPRCPRAFPIRD